MDEAIKGILSLGLIGLIFMGFLMVQSEIASMESLNNLFWIIFIISAIIFEIIFIIKIKNVPPMDMNFAVFLFLNVVFLIVILFGSISLLGWIVFTINNFELDPFMTFLKGLGGVVGVIALFCLVKYALYKTFVE